MTEPDSATMKEACTALRYSEPTVRRMIRDNVLRTYGSGRLLRISTADIDAYKRGEIVWQRSANRGSAGEAAEVAPSSGSGTGRTSPARRSEADRVVFLKDRTVTKPQKKP